MRIAIGRVGLAVAILGLMAGFWGPARAAIVVDFEEIPVPTGGLFIPGSNHGRGVQYHGHRA